MVKVKNIIYGLALLAATSCSSNKYILNQSNSKLGKKMPKLSQFENNRNLVKIDNSNDNEEFRGENITTVFYRDKKNHVKYSTSYDSKNLDLTEVTMYRGKNLLTLYGDKRADHKTNKISKMKKSNSRLERTISDTTKTFGLKDGKISLMSDISLFNKSNSSVHVFYNNDEEVRTIMAKGSDANKISKELKYYSPKNVYKSFFN